MRRRVLVVAAFALGAALTVAAAEAGISILIRPSQGVTFDPRTGGFCDPRGCPLGYWNMPVYYGPVLYQSTWYKGPVYYRERLGSYEFWVAGGWRRNEWNGPPPSWAGKPVLGPPLGHGYYRQPNWTDWKYWQKKGWSRDAPHDLP